MLQQHKNDFLLWALKVTHCLEYVRDQVQLLSVFQKDISDVETTVLKKEQELSHIQSVYDIE